MNGDVLHHCHKGLEQSGRNPEEMFRYKGFQVKRFSPATFAEIVKVAWYPTACGYPHPFSLMTIAVGRAP